MKLPDTVSASVEVALDPMNAFAVFTEEINCWWRPGLINWNDSARAVGIHIEPGVGGQVCTLLILFLLMNQLSSKLLRCWWRALQLTGHTHGLRWNLLWRRCTSLLQQAASAE